MTQFLICIVLGVFLLSLLPWPWLRVLLAIVLGWRVFGFLRKRLKARWQIDPLLSPSARVQSLNIVTVLILFSGVMSFFVFIAMVL